MRSTFGKYWVLSGIGIIVQSIIVIAVLIHTFWLDIGPGQGLSSNIIEPAILVNILNFIFDWSEIISALAVGSVLFSLFANLRHYRRRRYLNRFHIWAKNTVQALAEFRRSDVNRQENPLEHFEEMKTLLQKIHESYPRILAEAHIIGGEFDENARKIAQTIATIEEKAERLEESSFTDLRTLRHNLAIVMIFALESFQKERHKELRHGKPPKLMASK